jgi:hypothetical protein
MVAVTSHVLKYADELSGIPDDGLAVRKGRPRRLVLAGGTAVERSHAISQLFHASFDFHRQESPLLTLCVSPSTFIIGQWGELVYRTRERATNDSCQKIQTDSSSGNLGI